MKYIYCHVCGGSLHEKKSEIYECTNCGSVLDLSVFNETGETFTHTENQFETSPKKRIEIDMDTLPF